MTNQPTIHNPSHFEPADYQIEDYLDNKRPEYFGQSVEAWQEEIKFWEADMERAFGADWRRKIHRCAHCHNGRVRYITAVLHVPTNEVVVFGADCTERLGFANRQDWKLAQLKKKAEGRAIRMKIWRKREAFIKDNPIVATALEAVKLDLHKDNRFLADILRKLDTYGDLSPKQVAAIEPSLERDRKAADQRAADAAEVKGPAPSGRQQVQGVVLSIKGYDGYMGGTIVKMLVKLANNARVFCTVPMNGGEFHKGDTITFRASFQPKAEDPSFAYGSRPHLVSIDQVAAVEPQPEPAQPEQPAAVDATTWADQVLVHCRGCQACLALKPCADLADMVRAREQAVAS